MTEFINEILGISVIWLIDENLLSKSNYDALKRRNKIKQLRKGGNGRTALVEFDTLPERLRNKIVEKVGNPYELEKHREFRKHLKPDLKAIEFYSNYKMDSGRHLSTEKAKGYHTNVMFLNAIQVAEGEIKARRIAKGGKKSGVFDAITRVVNELKEEYRHTLPENPLRLKNRLKRYKEEGFESLIHRNFGNANSKKVNEQLENLIVSLASMTSNPFVEHVQDMYLEFLSGKTLVIDKGTGELFDRFDFYKDDKPLTISTATVWNVMRKAENESLINKQRLSRSEYSLHEEPFARRKPPQFSLSKISMDDRVLPTKTKDGLDVWVYYAIDVASQTYIGYVYSINKDFGLINACFQDMYKRLTEHNLYWPAEVEVERHLMGDIIPQLENMFSYVRLCNSGNSKEKRAEHFIKMKKYMDEHKYQENIGRWYGKGAYKKNEDRKRKLSREQVIQNDIESINRHNNALHTNQKKYKGLTRWEVLLANQNPDLSPPSRFRLLKEIGYRMNTSIRSKDTIRLQYEDYYIDTNVLNRLKPNNYEVTAYYMPDENNEINEAYVYQDNEFLCKATKVERFNESLAEQSKEDKEIMLKQQKRLSKRRKEIKETIEEKVKKVEIIQNDFEEVIPEEVEVVDVDFDDENNVNDDEDWNYSNSEFMQNTAIDSI